MQCMGWFKGDIRKTSVPRANYGFPCDISWLWHFLGRDPCEFGEKEIWLTAASWQEHDPQMMILHVDIVWYSLFQLQRSYIGVLSLQEGST